MVNLQIYFVLPIIFFSFFLRLVVPQKGNFSVICRSHLKSFHAMKHRLKLKTKNFLLSTISHLISRASRTNIFHIINYTNSIFDITHESTSIHLSICYIALHFVRHRYISLLAFESISISIPHFHIHEYYVYAAAALMMNSDTWKNDSYSLILITTECKRRRRKNCEKFVGI